MPASTKFELRKDLEFSQYLIGYGKQTVIKDPLKLEYFFFGSYESGLLKHLRVPVSLGELKANFESEIAPAKVNEADMSRFVGELMRDNLLVSNELGVGKRIETPKANLGLFSFTRFAGLLAIRFRGANPIELFSSLNPITRVFFHPFFLLLAVCIYLIAISFLILNIGSISGSGYIVQRFSQPDVLVPLGIAIIVVKILHEFGHGLACHAIGRKCHELGAMLLAFMPCLYCNVSDVWMEPNKWKRILVSVAGIYVELIIASICVPLWLFSLPGEFQFFCFSLFLVCSVNTIFVNGNPLLRYDGYFALADFLEVPNLADSSQKSLGSFWKSIFFNRDPDAVPVEPLLCAYAIASSLYRKFILVAILLMVYSFFDNLGLQNVGIFVCSLFVIASLLGGLLKMKQSLTKGLANIRFLSWFRTLSFLAVLAAIGYSVAIFPVSRKTYGTGKLVFSNEGIVFASNEGQLDWLKAEGDKVTEGEVVAQIHNRQIEVDLMEAKNAVQADQAALQNQEILNRQGIENTAKIELLKQSVKQQQEIIAKLLEQKEALTVVAPAAGTLAPIPRTRFEDRYQTDTLSRSTSSLFDENKGASVTRGESLALVADRNHAIFEFLVAEKDIGKVKTGQNAKLYFEQSGTDYVEGLVEAIGLERLDADGELDEQQNTERKTAYFLVSIRPKGDADFVPRFNASAKAMIIGDTYPLYKNVWKYLRDNFDF